MHHDRYPTHSLLIRQGHSTAPSPDSQGQAIQARDIESQRGLGETRRSREWFWVLASR